jgi:hypothetical protein
MVFFRDISFEVLGINLGIAYTITAR